MEDVEFKFLQVGKKEIPGDLLCYLQRHVIISDNKQGTPGLHAAI